MGKKRFAVGFNPGKGCAEFGGGLVPDFLRMSLIRVNGKVR